MPDWFHFGGDGSEESALAKTQATCGGTTLCSNPPCLIVNTKLIATAAPHELGHTSLTQEWWKFLCAVPRCREVVFLCMDDCSPLHDCSVVLAPQRCTTATTTASAGVFCSRGIWVWLWKESRVRSAVQRLQNIQ